MSKTWYPVIDYGLCSECGNCVSMCCHGVYDNKRMPAPVVINPEGCVQGCHGCGEKCPTGAITYAGDFRIGTSCSDCACSCGDGNGSKCC